MLVLAGLGIGAKIGIFYLHQHEVGGRMLRIERTKIVAASSPAGLAICKTAAPAPTTLPVSSMQPTGLIEIPAIGLVAPVVPGDDTAQLAVAVSHLPGSSWPGPDGTAILAAHDVSYFAHIDQLRKNDIIHYVTPCETFTYRVEKGVVVARGTPVYQTVSPRLILVTCYPLDALYYTPNRYLVTADLVSTVHVAAGLPKAVTPPVVPTVPAPPALVAQGLGLDNNPFLLGTLSITGHPAARWEEGPDPINDEAAVLSEYFGALRSAGQNEPSWWHALAPGVTFSDAAPLDGASITANDLDAIPVLDVDGSTFTGAQITTEPVLAGTAHPGPWTIHMVVSVTPSNTLQITSWQMTPG